MSINALNDLLQDSQILKNRKEELKNWKVNTKKDIRRIKENPLYESYLSWEEKEALTKLESIVDSINVDEVNI